MPLYDYRCTSCGKVTEVRHGFDEQFADKCAACGGTLQRVFNPAPVHFKGSGFYVTDSRSKKAEPSEKAEKAEATPASETSAAGEKTASEKTPGDKTTAEKSGSGDNVDSKPAAKSGKSEKKKPSSESAA